MSSNRVRLPKIEPTPETVYWKRRDFIRQMGLGGIALAAAGVAAGPQLATMAQDDVNVMHPALRPGIDRKDILKRFPAKRNAKFNFDTPLTKELAPATFNNFYEFTTEKDMVWRLAQGFNPDPWTIEVTGECNKPTKFSIDDIYKKFGGDMEERTYRFRCVEAWAMDVPWTGIELNRLLKAVDPKASAKYVRFFTANRPKEMPGIVQNLALPKPYHYPWPYFEALRMDEAMNELALLCTGIYGRPLPRQHGAPFRIIVPWKYGYKSPKSIDRIELVAKKPTTFWEKLQPAEYPFESNVNPNVPHPRWSQARERMIPDNQIRPTLLYNGYADYVGKLYRKG